jgi:hypothetical protein
MLRAGISWKGPEAGTLMSKCAEQRELVTLTTLMLMVMMRILHCYHMTAQAIQMSFLVIEFVFSKYVIATIFIFIQDSANAVEKQRDQLFLIWSFFNRKFVLPVS